MPPAAAVAITVLLVAAALKSRAVTPSGAAAGGGLAILFALMPALAAFCSFVLFVVAGTGVSRVGLAVKRGRGVAQERSGARGAIHALANAGFAGAMVVLWLAGLTPAGAATLMACGSLAAALSDTVSSELGQAWGARPRHVLTLQRVAWGTDGAVSAAGTAAGLAAAVLAAFVARAAGCDALAAVTVGGVGGNLVDTLLGASVEARLGRAGNTLVNIAGSAAGGLITLALGWSA